MYVFMYVYTTIYSCTVTKVSEYNNEMKTKSVLQMPGSFCFRLTVTLC